MVNKKILVFTTTKENNGTKIFRDNLAKFDSKNFISIESYYGCFKFLAQNKGNVKGIFAMSTLHFLIAHAFVSLFNIKIPIVLGMYHPRQWDIYLLGKEISKTRYDVTRKMISYISHKNIIHSSIVGVNSSINAGVERDKKLFNIIAGPVETFSPRKKYKDIFVHNEVKIVTVGRLVDFKTSNIYAMIDVLNDYFKSGYENFTYDIYGDGPDYEKIRSYIDSLTIKNKVNLKGVLKQEFYAETMTKYDLGFSMAGAMIQACSVGLISIIGIQGERSPQSYGFFDEFDHSDIPIFGDPMPNMTTKSLSDLIKEFKSLSLKELNKKCDCTVLQSTNYGKEKTINRILDVFSKAEVVNHKYISFYELILILIETRVSLFLGRNDIVA